MDFPDPDSPIIARVWPGKTSKDKESTARNDTRFLFRDTERFEGDLEREKS